MTNFAAGFARIDITPALDTYMSGYFHARQAEGVLDPLFATALALRCGTDSTVIFSLDLIAMDQAIADKIKEKIAALCSLKSEQVFIACTHTHTGPVISNDPFPIDQDYLVRLEQLMIQAAVSAFNDLKPARAFIARGEAPGIAFVRRFRMKDGTVRTNPGIGNPDIIEAIGTPDETVQLVRLTRENAKEILLVNFQVHPDVIGGSLFSADHIKFVRDSLEAALANSLCIYFNGAQGDVNHINVWADAETGQGYEHARHMGQVIAGAALQVYGKAEPVAADSIAASETVLKVDSNKGDPAQYEEARRLVELNETGRQDEIPETGMGITTLVAEAHRMLALADGPDQLALKLSAVRFGDVCLAGIPGEPFTGIGQGIKAASPCKMQIICCCANGDEGYFPMQDAYDEGGYEARSSRFKAGVAEQIIEASIDNIKQTL